MNGTLAKNVRQLTPTSDLRQAKRDLEELGCCIVLDLIPAEQVRTLRDRLAEQADMEKQQGVAALGNGGRGKNVWIGNDRENDPAPWQAVRSIVNKGRPFIDLLMHPVILELMEHTLRRSDFTLSGANAIIVRRGAIPMYVHCDQQIIPFATPVPAVANVMVTLSEFSKASGATRVLPGSHVLPPPVLEFDRASGDLRNVEEVELISCECPAGSGIFFDGRLWHSSAAHDGEDVRYAISALYCQPWMRQQDNLPASIQDDVYDSLTNGEKGMFGFKSSPFGRIDPRVPGDRGNVDAAMPFIPELRRGTDRKAVRSDYVGTFAIDAYDKSKKV